MSNEAERMQILDMIERGKISAEDGLVLLQALVPNQVDLDESDLEDEPLDDSYPSRNQSSPDLSFQAQPVLAQGAQFSSPASTSQDEATTEKPEFTENLIGEAIAQPAKSIPIETQKWKRFWMIPFWIGVAILVAGSGLMYWALQSRGIGVAFFFATLPFVLGLGILLLSWQSRTSPWIHLRISQPAGEKPEHIALSFPLPIRPALWFFRTFGGHIPKVQNVSLDEILWAVNQSTSADNPIYIQVDEGDKGEKVEIYIG